ncbi:kinase-like domain-containing protein [Epithele typhae]|uniref:kinase-like domain-containing protein n=1 Tax=Epithele typhae TaxID=378194 RepID=UPI0020079798|nr:kinase-like domain-containing protein [Epithele typhae]KAH9939787.1 kinase-like domain-containing protein [Epithele typhae]
MPWDRREESPGYAPLGLGDGLDGICGNYKIIRKLGWGTESSVWLVERVAANHPNMQLGKLLVAKVLNMHATVLELDEFTCQVPLCNEINRRSTPEEKGYMHGTAFTVTMLDGGTVSTRHGDHIFTIMPPMSTTMRSVERSFRTANPDRDVLLARRVLKQVSSALECMHRLGYVHTDVKADNFFVPLPDECILELRTYLERFPAATLPPRVFPEHGPDPVTCVRSQPYPPVGSDHELPRILVNLGDFSSTIDATMDTTDILAMPRMLRAPEVILGRRWAQPIDIWALGCWVAELLLRDRLFFPGKHPDGTAVSYSEHLSQMVEVLGPFSEKTLAKCPRRDDAFDTQGLPKPIHGTQRFNLPPLRQRLAAAGLTGTTLNEVEALLCRMLRLDPDERATASEVLADPFIHRFNLTTNSLL